MLSRLRLQLSQERLDEVVELAIHADPARTEPDLPQVLPNQEAAVYFSKLLDAVVLQPLDLLLQAFEGHA